MPDRDYLVLVDLFIGKQRIHPHIGIASKKKLS